MLIIVVEDNADLAFGLSRNLQMEGYDVATASSLCEARKLIDERPPNLILLDLMLPDGDGLDLLNELRAHGDTTPVIVLSARISELDRVSSFRTGADDYVPKPFGVMELMERIRVRLATHQSKARRIQVGDCSIDLDGQAIYRGRTRTPLTRQETRLLVALLRAEGRLITRDELLHQVWGLPTEAETRRLDYFINSLRKKIEPHPQRPKHILTERGSGYRLAV